VYIRILGSAAGGGFPQWNCNCTNCKGVRDGSINALRRSQSSICVSADGKQWVLFNASPDILSQIAQFSPLQPQAQIRGSGVAAIVLMDSQIDHCTGLLMLREGCPHTVYCSDMVHQDLNSGFPLFPMLKHWNGGLMHKTIELETDNSFVIDGIDGLRFSPIPVSGKAPPYSPHRHNPHVGDNIGIRIEDTRSGKQLFYCPGLGNMDDRIMTELSNADCLLVDGTFWSENEMSESGVGDKTAASMGHLPQSGSGGMIELLRPLKNSRKVLIHINNTNPILREDSPQRQILDSENIEVAFDGMDISL